MSNGWQRLAQRGWAAAFLCTTAPTMAGADTPVTQEQLKELQRQNELLQRQVQKQQQLIDDLSGKVANLERQKSTADEPGPPPAKSAGFSLGNVRFSGEGGVAFFRSEAHGPSPNSEFRVDEAKLFVEAPLWKDTYFFAELNITTREGQNTYLEPGELYVDFENVSRLWN